MSHKTQTVVRHRIELDEREQFEIKNYSGNRYRVVGLYAEVTDGSLSSVRATAYKVLKSGQLGAVRSDPGIWASAPHAQEAYAVLRAHGIKTPEPRS